jgi:hypothetical protein
MIVEQYVHTLIPQDAQFCPRPQQVRHFVDGLSKLGAAPLNAEFKIGKPSGRVRSFTDPLTGEIRTIPGKEIIALNGAANLNRIVSTLDQYVLAMEGHGPPTLPAFPLYLNGAPFADTYGFSVHCCVEAEPVSMSDLGGEEAGYDVPFFGKPCGKRRGTALFRHPLTSVLIEVTNASCARFWVEFEFGKWLLPKIDHWLDILDPAIADLANQCFGLAFAQGFHHFQAEPDGDGRYHAPCGTNEMVRRRVGLGSAVYIRRIIT